MISRSSLTHGLDNDLEALVMLILPPDATVSRVSIQLQGSKDIAVVAGGDHSVPDGQPDGHARMQVSLEVSSQDGMLRPVYRVPVTVRPLHADAIIESPSLVEIHTSFLSDGRPLKSHDRLMLHANVPGTSTAMLAAGAPAPAAALALLVSRRGRLRR